MSVVGLIVILVFVAIGLIAILDRLAKWAGWDDK